MRLVLIRHAQSIRNRAFTRGQHFYKKGQRKLDTPNHLLPITKEGEAQAEALAKRIYEEGRLHPSYIIHSGFVRTEETATIIKKHLEKEYLADDIVPRIEMRIDTLIRERDAGYAFEMNEEEASKHFPYLKDYWIFEGKWFAVPPGGESFVTVMDRVNIFLQKITSNWEYNDRTLFVVTHGGTMQAFRMVLENIPFSRAENLVDTPKNCETLEYLYTRGVWKRDFDLNIHRKDMFPM